MSEPGGGVAWYGFWGFLNNTVAVTVTFLVLQFTSLLKVVVTTPVASFTSLVFVLAFLSNMRKLAAPKYLSDYVGILWPLSLTWQALFGGCIGFITSYAQQQSRLHIHHDWEEEALRYTAWVVTVFFTCLVEAVSLGVLCRCGPGSFKQHTE